MATIFDKLFSVDKKILKEIEKKAHQVDSYAGAMESLSDEELRGKTFEFKEGSLHPLQHLPVLL